MRLSSAAYLFGQGIKNIWNNRVMSVASFCIMTVSLLMIGFTVIITANINSLVSDIEGKNEVVIFLTDEAPGEYITELETTLSGLPNVSSVAFYSKEQAFEDIKKDMTDAEDIFGYISDSPLPDAYRIKIRDVARMSETLMAINRLEYIENVKAPYDFVNVLTGLRTIISIVSAVMLVALIIVSFVIISNTTRASVDIRKREISIMKFVGATNFFIKVPFFIEGLVMGTFAGVVSAVFTYVGYNAIVDLLSTEATLLTALGTNGFIPIKNFVIQMSVGYVSAGAVISAMGTVMSTRKYVKV